MDKQELLQAYKDVEKSGNRLGFLKESLIPLANQLVKEGHLKEKTKGIYTLT